jgi:hypothetical protein
MPPSQRSGWKQKLRWQPPQQSSQPHESQTLRVGPQQSRVGPQQSSPQFAWRNGRWATDPHSPQAPQVSQPQPFMYPQHPEADSISPQPKANIHVDPRIGYSSFKRSCPSVIGRIIGKIQPTATGGNFGTVYHGLKVRPTLTR